MKEEEREGFEKRKKDDGTSDLGRLVGRGVMVGIERDRVGVYEVGVLSFSPITYHMGSNSPEE